MSGLGTEWKKISNDEDIKSLIRRNPDKTGKVSTNDFNIQTSDRKEFLITKDLNLRPTSFRFKYNEHWLKEDTNHFHFILRQYNADLPLDDYDNPALLTNSLQILKSKHKQVKSIARLQDKIRKNANVATEEDFTIDSEDEIDDEFIAMSAAVEDKGKKKITKASKPLEKLPGKTIDQVLYDDLKAKYVKVISIKPLKIVWDNKRICENTTLASRTIDKLRREGIGIENLKKDDPVAYYNAFNRCYDVGRYELNGKYYCRTHFRDKKYGRTKDEDFHD
jgi:hypothetical protein